MSENPTQSPWLSMWTCPRSTIRALVHDRPKYGVFYLATFYALKLIFSSANYWSLGLSTDLLIILFFSLFLAPILGVIWLYFNSWIFYFTGRWLKGTARPLPIRTALAWSKIPMLINLMMWFVLIFIGPDLVFIQDGGGATSVFVNFITFILFIWSLVLLVQSIREIQGFSVPRTLINILMAGIISFGFVVILISVLRYIYIVSL